MKTKNIFEITTTILGTFIGAGFIGGKEVVEYFCKFGYFSIFMVFMLFIVFAIFVYILLFIGNKYNKYDKNIECSAKSNQNIANILILISSIISISAMIAGAYNISLLVFPDIALLIVIILLVLTYIAIRNKFCGLNFINKAIVPILLISILFITTVTLSNSNEFYIPEQTLSVTIFGGFSSVLLYIFFNMFMLSVLLVKIGYRYTKKEIKFGAIVSSAIISILMLFICVSIFSSGESVYNSSIPLLAECININYYMSYIFAVCQLFGIFTTLVSSTYISANIISAYKFSYKSSIILSLIFGTLLSLLGFDNIVKYLYIVISIFGIIYFCILINTICKFKFVKL